MVAEDSQIDECVTTIVFLFKSVIKDKNDAQKRPGGRQTDVYCVTILFYNDPFKIFCLPLLSQ